MGEAVKANPAIFREYDVRGVSGRDLTPDVVRALGRALAAYAARKGERRLLVGRDCRTSSPGFRDALVEGMVAAGADVLDVGLVPTPVLYFAHFHFERPAGVMITGSHNPPDHNGFKMLVSKAALHGSEIQELKRMIAEDDYGPAPEAPGRVSEGDAIGPYRARVAGDVKLARTDLRVVVDAGNGMGGPTASALMKDLGLDPTLLYCDLDGTFPNHHPDPSDEHTLEALKRTVVETNADAGIAYDGDADRLGVVCLDGGKPRVLWGDELLILFARAVLRAQPGATVIGEVKCSQRLFDDIAKHGGKAIMWKVGHSLIKAKMRETGAALAGEMSGHIFFAHRYYGYDDAIYSSARLLEILAAAPAGTTLAGLLADVPPAVNTPEIRVECPDETKFDVVARATEALKRRYPDASVVDLDGVRILWAGEGWGLLRASNTQPVLVMRFEAVDQERLEAVRARVELAVTQARLNASA
ncbi:MAG TPA: phosphomannomutase/phosphoglucomutase [Myxococcota bacterium]|jgi:phosphomannomutase/phosphoglucomutase|nr:phosphomannomutase/phosphoglucomutase [Myxococcota bacterium]